MSGKAAPPAQAAVEHKHARTAFIKSIIMAQARNRDLSGSTTAQVNWTHSRICHVCQDLLPKICKILQIPKVLRLKLQNASDIFRLILECPLHLSTPLHTANPSPPRIHPRITNPLSYRCHLWNYHCPFPLLRLPQLNFWKEWVGVDITKNLNPKQSCEMLRKPVNLSDFCKVKPRCLSQ